ncbi:hypothetical protein [Pseudarthrobacter sp. LT1]|uniref:hypothetical protein n=1 Tax=Pseudarthrobacter sp. LT1 TaxID=3111450 RepID=UPI002D78DE58|nr:hypothetical protein [Pseudarthrobacter sp. LT1]WRT13073.1 hypothetical protein VIK36_17200 [Pseudarthrobacter sp. LT1]
METNTISTALIESEADGLVSRLDQIKPFVMQETMVLAAALPRDAQLLIERFLHAGRHELRVQVAEFLDWLHGDGRTASPAEQQRRFVLIRLQFNVVLAQFDLFTEVVTQRSEHSTGVWLSGLDILAQDALRLEGNHDDGDARLVVYLARGAGAAIRRAKTRLPGGKPNPVGIIRLPRERMVGSGIASSLAHEVGHQGAAQLDLVASLRAELDRRAQQDPDGGWGVWSLWISEIVADMWSVATVGITSTVGLLAVVSLPRYFVFRPGGTDPHPMPYLRVLISAALGDALYPHPQWRGLASVWRAMYPPTGLPAEHLAWIGKCEAHIGDLVSLLMNHPVPAAGGRKLGTIWPTRERRPERLLRLHQAWGGDFGVMARQRPALVFAVLGQAKAAGRITAEEESSQLSSLLTAWAVRSSLDDMGAPAPLSGSPAQHLTTPALTTRR